MGVFIYSILIFHFSSNFKLFYFFIPILFCFGKMLIREAESMGLMRLFWSWPSSRNIFGRKKFCTRDHKSCSQRFSAIKRPQGWFPTLKLLLKKFHFNKMFTFSLLFIAKVSYYNSVIHLIASEECSRFFINLIFWKNTWFISVIFWGWYIFL